jgi:hypothetical protein
VAPAGSREAGDVSAPLVVTHNPGPEGARLTPARPPASRDDREPATHAAALTRTRGPIRTRRPTRTRGAAPAPAGRDPHHTLSHHPPPQPAPRMVGLSQPEPRGSLSRSPSPTPAVTVLPAFLPSHGRLTGDGARQGASIAPATIQARRVPGKRRRARSALC